MRILFFLHKIGPYHHARFSELAKNCELTVVEILPASQEYDWKSVDETSFYKIIKIEEHKIGKEIKGKKLLNAVKQLIEEHRPQAIITMGWNNKTYWAILYMGNKMEIPVFCTSDSILKAKKRYYILEFLKGTMIKGFNGFLTAGKQSENYLNYLGIPLSKIFKPFDVVDNNHFKSNGKTIKSFNYYHPYIVCVSRYIPVKNLFKLIIAYKEYILRYGINNTILYIIGSGPLELQLKDLIKKLNLSNQIILYPFIQYDELPPIYRHAKGLILPSLSDQWGLVVNEAMAAGIPVMVSNRCGCTDDLIIEGENGWTFEPSIEGIVMVLKKFFNTPPEKLKQMGMKGQEIISNYDLKDHKFAILNMIDTLKDKKIKLSYFQKLIIYLRLYF